MKDLFYKVQDLIAGGSAKTLDCLGNFTVPDGKCSGIQFVCATISPVASSSYVDAINSNNVKCIGISSQRQCRPSKFIYDKLNI